MVSLQNIIFLDKHVVIAMGFRSASARDALHNIHLGGEAYSNAWLNAEAEDKRGAQGQNGRTSALAHQMAAQA